MLTSEKLNQRCPYATPEELAWLQGWLRENSKGRNIPHLVIIGAGPGVMPIALLEVPRKFIMWVVEIDTFQWLDAHVEAAGFVGDKRMIKIHGDSYVAGKSWQSKLDLVIVDGDHSYEGVRRDIEAWMPRIRLGGKFMFHDYPTNLQNEPTGVKEAVRDHLHHLKFKPVGTIGISRIYERIK